MQGEWKVSRYTSSSLNSSCYRTETSDAHFCINGSSYDMVNQVSKTGCY